MFSDPAFTENRQVRVHRWVPWIAGFSAAFVADAINRYNLRSSDNTLVFDPFAGVGTTLVEGKIRGFNVAGCEINPFALMACQVKLNWEVDPEELAEWVSRLSGYVRKIDSSNFKGAKLHDFPNETTSVRQNRVVESTLRAPEGFHTREPFFNPAIEKKMLLLKEFILEVPEPVRDYFWVAFGSILVKYSRYAYGPSLGRKTVMQIRLSHDAPVGDVLFRKMEEVLDDLRWLKNEVIPKLGSNPEHRIFRKSVFECLDEIRDESIDLVATSPPYLNNYHYPRNTRPQLYWLDMVKKPSDINHIELESFGKFWQSVRELPPIYLAFEMPELAQVIETIRKQRHEKGIYGGNGWANYAATYFNDVNRFFNDFKRKMKRNGIMVWVLGNSILQGIEVKTEEYLAKIAESHGLKRVDGGIHILRRKRIGSSIVNTHVRSQTPANTTVLYEAAVVLRRK
jgi:DNA modification methylase